MTPDVPVLYRDYLPTDLRPSLQRHHIGKTVLVQAAQTVAETDFLLDVAAAEDSIAGVVGWLDLEDPQFIEQFDRYRENPKFVGLRPMLQDLADDRWILRPKVLAALQYIAAADFPFEFLVFPRHLSFVLETLNRIPQLRATIDHLAKPEIRARKLEPWRDWIAQAAQHPGLYCKISGIVTEADHRSWTIEDLRPYVEHVVECFGFDRLMFGSDWPVCLQAASYDQVIAAVKQILSQKLDESAERKLFGENAVRFYKLDV